MKHFHTYFLSTFLILSAISSGAYAQSFKVKGTVTTSGTPVKYAAVTFLDSYDFSVQYNAVTDSTGAFSLGSITAVKQESQLPKRFQLEQNYPNPFSSSTAISYELEKQSDVRVVIYDVLGRKIRTFDVGFQSAGTHGVVWNGRNDFGKVVTPGVYLYRLEANGQAQVRKMVFGIGENTNSVFLPGMTPSGTKMGMEGIQVVPGLPSATETFLVDISNTDSTSPTIIPKGISNVVVQSDTSFGFTVNTPQAIVYLDSTQQVISGFGGANTLIFRPDMTPAEVQTAFGDGNGQIGLTIMRVSIDPDSANWYLSAPSALAAENLGAKVIATPWTPPAWMKTNSSLVSGSLSTSAYPAFASYLKAFGDTMASYGVTVNGISVQNEPNFNASYQSCLWNGTQFLNFMKNNAPAVGYPVFMPEADNFTHTESDSTLNDSVAASHVAFIGGHLYGDVDNNGNVTSAVQYPLALQKGKQLWMTEYLINSGGSSINSVDTGWTGAMQTAKTINDCMQYNMSAYVWWYIVRYYGPIDDGSDGRQVGSVTHKGYVMSQFARFVRPGFYRVSATASPVSNVFVTAYKNGAKIVVVVVNLGSNAVTLPFTLQGGTAGGITPYVTSSTQNCVQGSDIPVSSGVFNATIQASSVTTFVSF